MRMRLKSAKIEIDYMIISELSKAPLSARKHSLIMALLISRIYVKHGAKVKDTRNEF